MPLNYRRGSSRIATSSKPAPSNARNSTTRSTALPRPPSIPRPIRPVSDKESSRSKSRKTVETIYEETTAPSSEYEESENEWIDDDDDLIQPSDSGSVNNESRRKRRSHQPAPVNINIQPHSQPQSQAQPQDPSYYSAAGLFGQHLVPAGSHHHFQPNVENGYGYSRGYPPPPGPSYPRYPSHKVNYPDVRMPYAPRNPPSHAAPQNPTTGSSAPAGYSYFDNPPVPQPYTGYYGHHGHYSPAYLQPYGLPPSGSYGPPPSPPATEAAPVETPPPAADPEKLRLEAELAELKAALEKSKAAETQKELEELIRRDAEDSFSRRMEDLRKAQEEAKIEIERAKAEAERTAREALEAEMRAAEERRKQMEEITAVIERDVRAKIEAERQAEENERKMRNRMLEDMENIARKCMLRNMEEMMALTKKKLLLDMGLGLEDDERGQTPSEPRGIVGEDTPQPPSTIAEEEQKPRQQARADSRINKSQSRKSPAERSPRRRDRSWSPSVRSISLSSPRSSSPVKSKAKAKTSNSPPPRVPEAPGAVSESDDGNNSSDSDHSSNASDSESNDDRGYPPGLGRGGSGGHRGRKLRSLEAEELVDEIVDALADRFAKLPPYAPRRLPMRIPMRSSYWRFAPSVRRRANTYASSETAETEFTPATEMSHEPSFGLPSPQADAINVVMPASLEQRTSTITPGPAIQAIPSRDKTHVPESASSIVGESLAESTVGARTDTDESKTAVNFESAAEESRNSLTSAKIGQIEEKEELHSGTGKLQSKLPRIKVRPAIRMNEYHLQPGFPDRAFAVPRSRTPAPYDGSMPVRHKRGVYT